MKYGLIGYSVAAAVVLAVLSLASMPVASQSAAQTKKPTCVGCSVDGKTTPRLPDGHPDLNGYWGGGTAGNDQHLFSRGQDGSVVFDFGGNEIDEKGNNLSATPGDDFQNQVTDPALQPPYKPEYMAKVKAIADETYGVTNAKDPIYECKPGGIPRASFGEMQIVQTAQVIAMIRGDGITDRIIYTDGRAHPDNLDTSYMGDSIGHWEGDTLVVDVTALNDETWLSGSYGGLKYGILHSSQEHVIEHWTREGNTLTYQATIEDPVMFTKPWVLKPRRIQHAQAGPDDYLLQIPCLNHDEASHVVKPTENDQFKCDYGPQCVSGAK